MNLLKKIVCFCFLIVFCDAIAWAQCPDGNVVLETQEEVDDFAILYPDCTEVEGDLRIGKLQVSTNIVDLNPLNQIVSVGGVLSIRHNPNLNGLNGLENLTSIGGLRIEFNDGLMSLNSLENLTSIGGILLIKVNDNLSNLSGLENVTSIGTLLIHDSELMSLSGLDNITSIGGYMWLESNDNLTNLNGLSSLTSIEGYIDIEYNAGLINLNGLENLTSIGGNIQIDHNHDLINLSGLENLTSIEGDTRIEYNNDLTSLNGLENLTSIGGNMQIRYNDNLMSLNGLDNVTSFDGNLWVHYNSNLSDISGLLNVTSIGGSLSIRNSGNLVNLNGLENLTSISGSLALSDLYNLIDLNSLNALSTIGGNLDVSLNYNLNSLSGLSNITSVGGDIEISANYSLNSLSGLENIISIGGGLLISRNGFTNLRGLDNITSVGGDLGIIYSGNLVNLKGLNNLTSIGGRLEIENNDNLLDLSDLENLNSINGQLHIKENINLTNIGGLQNIDYNTIAALYIYENPVLSVCSLPSVCAFIENGGYAYLPNNAQGCSNVNEVLADCAFIPKVKVDAFYDVNENKVQDSNEPDYFDISLIINPGNNLYYAQNNGLFYVEPGSYIVSFDEVNNPNWQLTTDSTSYFVSLEAGKTDTITFGIYPTQQISKIQTIINSASMRCNEVITLDVTTKNLGTTIASGIMWLTIDDAIPTFNFIHEPDTIIADFDTYGWYFTDLYPGQSIIKNVEVTVPGPPDFELGERLLFGSFSQFTDANGNDTSEGFRYNPEVRCSYDPNDKLVNPNREGDYVLFEEDFIYTIRFQNTGNDVAYDVVIRDTLDANLDRSTFRVLGSSHANRLNTILNEDEGILTFEFRDIFLPDSTSNFDASQGYVNYLISPFDGLAEETPITNSAGIYFDLNPPVITNTTQSIMVSELPTVSTETPDNFFNFNILPNPNDGTFTVQGIPQGTYQILNTSGQIIRQGEMGNDISLNISDAAQGVYFISVTIDNETFVKRIVKM